jgi:hypothetical protein
MQRIYTNIAEKRGEKKVMLEESSRQIAYFDAGRTLNEFFFHAQQA